MTPAPQEGVGFFVYRKAHVKQLWNRMPDWLRGMIAGATMYTVCLILLYGLVLVGVGWASLALLSVLSGPMGLYSNVAFLTNHDFPGVHLVVQGVSAILVWVLLGGALSKLIGFRRGIIVMLILQSILIIVGAAALFVALVVWSG